jgi:hypothetical protein
MDDDEKSFFTRASGQPWPLVREPAARCMGRIARANRTATQASGPGGPFGKKMADRTRRAAARVSPPAVAQRFFEAMASN